MTPADQSTGRTDFQNGGRLRPVRQSSTPADCRETLCFPPTTAKGTRSAPSARKPRPVLARPQCRRICRVDGQPAPPNPKMMDVAIPPTCIRDYTRGGRAPRLGLIPSSRRQRRWERSNVVDSGSFWNPGTGTSAPFPARWFTHRIHRRPENLNAGGMLRMRWRSRRARRYLSTARSGNGPPWPCRPHRIEVH